MNMRRKDYLDTTKITRRISASNKFYNNIMNRLKRVLHYYI